MKTVIPDANVFLRFLLNDIPSQVKKADALFRKAKDEKVELTVPQIVIFEIHFTLDKYYQFKKKVINEKLKAIISTEYFNIDDRSIFIKAMDYWEAENISFPDAFIVSYCENIKGELFSFDKKLSKLIY